MRKGAIYIIDINQSHYFMDLKMTQIIQNKSRVHIYDHDYSKFAINIFQ